MSKLASLSRKGDGVGLRATPRENAGSSFSPKSLSKKGEYGGCPPPIESAPALSLSGPTLVELLRAVLGKGAPFRFRARGSSMSPSIRDGDVVTVSSLSGISPCPGDVVAFAHPGSGKLVVHRVVGKNKNSYLIKGDSVSEVDGFIPEASILGYVGKVERDGKRVFFGLGPEKLLIAFLTRGGLLSPLLLPVWRLLRFIISGASSHTPRNARASAPAGSQQRD